MADRPRILYVDDDEELRTLYAYILDTQGFDVETCENGHAAKAIVRGGGVDFILLDLMMPGMDGLAFLRWLRREQKSDVPVLMLSAVTKAGVKDALLEGGADEVLLKPVGTPELLRQVGKLLHAGGLH